MSDLCLQCPRRCSVDRIGTLGFCRAPREIRLARVSLHPWEEPCLAGEHGAGTLFFVGCNLRCVFCQNREISRGERLGRTVSPDELVSVILDLQASGASCIDLVTPTPYAEDLIPVLRAVRPRLSIPVVYNCGGYESVETLRRLDSLVDVYLPDIKYLSQALSTRYSHAPDYFAVTVKALAEMLRQVGSPVLQNGMLLRGVLVRHLVLPGCRRDSIDLLRALCDRFGSNAFLLSLMSQYTPAFADSDADAALHRRLTTFEYQSVLDTAHALGFDGYLQEPSAADTAYTPDFSADESTLAVQIENLRKNAKGD